MYGIGLYNGSILTKGTIIIIINRKLPRMFITDIEKDNKKMQHILEYEDFLADKGLVLEASKKDTKVLDKLIDQNLKNSQEMKKVVLQWKKAEGKEKIDLTNKLKELTAKKQELEKNITAEVEELDKGIGLEVVKEAAHEFNGKNIIKNEEM